METIQIETYNHHQIATVFHDSGNKKIVIFCHGFRSSAIGPNRFFVGLARLLQREGISSLRFDQYGSGNSEGDFLDSSFEDWMNTTKVIVNKYLNNGYKVVLLGQSMGGATVLAVASQLQEKLSSVVAWVPGISTEAPNVQGEYMEELGQKVRWNFWEEAHDANIVECVKKTKIPEYIFFATHDEYISKEERDAIISNVQSYQKIEILQDHVHSSWSYEQATHVINKTLEFIKQNI